MCYYKLYECWEIFGSWKEMSDKAKLSLVKEMNYNLIFAYRIKE